MTVVGVNFMRVVHFTLAIRDVNQGRSVKAKASKPRSEACKAKVTDPRPRPRMQK